MESLIFISDIFLFSLAFLWLIAASITDLRNRNVPNWLSFSLIAIAFSVRAIASVITLQADYFLYSLASFAIFFILANLFYYTRTFGGGDVKLLMALSVVFATTPSFIKSFFIGHFVGYGYIGYTGNFSFLLSFILNILVIGAVYGFLFSVFFSIKNRKAFLIKFKNINKEKKMLLGKLCCLIIGILFFISAIFFNNSFSGFFILAIIFLCMPYLYIAIKSVDAIMIKKVNPNKLSEGDWLLRKIKLKNKGKIITIKPNVHGLSEEEIALLRKAKKSVKIKYGLPFVPVFLIALICSLFCNILFSIMQAII